MNTFQCRVDDSNGFIKMLKELNKWSRLSFDAFWPRLYLVNPVIDIGSVAKATFLPPFYPFFLSGLISTNFRLQCFHEKSLKVAGVEPGTLFS